MYQPEQPVFRIVTSAGEAEEHLRVIRQAMERSTRHSTFSGLSGIAVGLLALAGCLLTNLILRSAPDPLWRYLFFGLWTAVLGSALVADYLLTKRRARQVGKGVRSPYARHLIRAAAPGFLAALAITIFYVLNPSFIGPYIYGFWMLCYAASVLAVAQYSVREVSILGWAFMAAGMVTLLLPPTLGIGPRAVMALTFGGFHIVYGVWMGYKYGW
jgi:hypothetical protein